MPRYFFVGICALAVLFAFVNGGPIQVRVEQDNNKSFHIGPEARTTFELTEEYHPLSTAYNQQHRPRAMSSSLSKGPAGRIQSSPAHILVDFNSSDDNALGSQHSGRYQSDTQRTLNTISAAGAISSNNNQVSPLKSHWLEWTRWSACANGERIRIRQCVEVDNVRCEGESVQRQTCFSAQSQVPVANDPLVIEKEILGVDTPIMRHRV